MNKHVALQRNSIDQPRQAAVVAIAPPQRIRIGQARKDYAKPAERGMRGNHAN